MQNVFWDMVPPKGVLPEDHYISLYSLISKLSKGDELVRVVAGWEIAHILAGHPRFTLNSSFLDDKLLGYLGDAPLTTHSNMDGNRAVCAFRGHHVMITLVEGNNQRVFW